MNKLLILPFAIILLAIVLLQSGCNNEPENTSFPDVTASSDTIYGTLKYKKQIDINTFQLIDWPFGPAIIRVIIGGETVYSNALQSNGNFSMVLPATVLGKNFTKLSDISIIYGGTIKVSPEALQYVNTTQFMVDYTENTVAKSMNVGQVVFNTNLSTYRNYYYYFYENDGSVAGTGTAGNVFNLVFSKGWGIAETNMSTTVPPYIISSKSVAAAPVNAVWSN